MDRVNSDLVRTLLNTVILRRRFLALTERTRPPSSIGVPEINVVDPDSSMEEVVHHGDGEIKPRRTRATLSPIVTSFPRRSSALSSASSGDMPLDSPLRLRSAFGLSSDPRDDDIPQDEPVGEQEGQQTADDGEGRAVGG